MKPRLSRSLRRIFAGVVVCCLAAQTGNVAAATLDDAGVLPSVSTTGIAWRTQMERQLRTVRDRTVVRDGGRFCRPRDPKAGPVHEPPCNMWVNGDIDYQKQTHDGGLPGFKLNSIGGTFGMDGRIGDHWILGGAVTGMSGRLSCKGAGNNASGDLDAWYANIFTRFEHGCWSHTLIGTAGWADVDLKRRGFVGGDYFQTSGKPDGLGLGVMYELTRSFHMGGDSVSDAWWQPVLNVAYIHSRIDSYTERGGDAAVAVGKQTYDNVVFGLGARMQTVVGRGFLNKDAVFSCRVLGKALAGGRRGKAEIGLDGDPDSVGVRSSRRGTFGVELGAGIDIPFGANSNSSIYAGCTAEIGGDYRSVNGVLGYHLSF